MEEILKNRLDPIINEYKARNEAWVNNKTLPVPDTNADRARAISTIMERMEALPANTDEYREYSFLTRCLSNGWLVSDIEALDQLYTAVRQDNWGNPPPPQEQINEFKTGGRKILDQLASEKVDTLAGRFNRIQNANDFFTVFWQQNEQFRAPVSAVTNMKNRIQSFEYPNDSHFYDLVSENFDSSKGIRPSDANEDAFVATMNRIARENTSYIFNELTDEERAAEETKPFVPNAGQRWNKMTIPASQAIRDVLGNAVYDEINEMSQGKAEDRKVKLHHSMGTKYQNQGHHVLELEFAGTTGKDVIKNHKDRGGGIDKTLDEDTYKAKYGTRAEKPSGGEFEYVHFKDGSKKTANNEDLKKMRYVFGGPNWVNIGEYSVENTREYARHFGGKFLKDIFDGWLAGKEKPKPIHIDLSGHSRGAVAAGQAVKLINQWVQEYCRTHEGAKDFAKQVNYDLRLFDPCPGVVTDLHLGSCNLKDIPNVNTTVICSMGINTADFIAPLQHVRGAKKIVLTMTDHVVDTDKKDDSQKSTLGDGKSHAQGYYDAETGEMHRGSGLNELPDGIYVSDEKHNLVRLTSYSQVNELFGKIYDKTSPQRIRARRIHKMVRDWFYENKLEMSFKDEGSRKLESAKNDLTQADILKVTSKRMRPVKAAIQQLQQMKKDGASKEDLIKQNESLIKVCREYMKNTTMPPYGDTARKVDLVADTLSYTMRENNHLTKELQAGKSSELDEKIKAHQERLENKDGYLKRKQEEESKRLKQEQDIETVIKFTAKTCKDTMARLDQTRVGKSGSTSYNNFYKTLEEGSKLTSQISVKNLSEYFKRLQEVSNSYTSSHDRLIGPVTGDGGKRIIESSAMGKFGKNAADQLNKLSAGLEDKKAPLGMKIADRQARIEEMKKKEASLNAEEKQPVKKQAPEPVLA